MERFLGLFASMSDTQFGALMLAITAITVAAFYFGKRLALHSPVLDINAGASQRLVKPKRCKTRAIRKRTPKPEGKKRKAEMIQPSPKQEDAEKYVGDSEQAPPEDH